MSGRHVKGAPNNGLQQTALRAATEPGRCTKLAIHQRSRT